MLGAGMCALFATGVASADLKVVIQFRQPGSGKIELYAAVFKARFKGTSAPVHPLVKVTLPKSGRPHDYALLAGERLASVHGHVATYVLLVEALRPFTSANAAQPLVGESLTIVDISGGSGLHNTPEALTIDNSTEPERAKLDALLTHAGVTDFSASSFGVRAFDDGHAFDWTARVVEWNKTWDNSWTLVSNSRASLTATIGKLQVLLHMRLSGGPLSTSLPPCQVQVVVSPSADQGTMTCTKPITSFTINAPPARSSTRSPARALARRSHAPSGRPPPQPRAPPQYGSPPAAQPRLSSGPPRP